MRTYKNPVKGEVQHGGKVKEILSIVAVQGCQVGLGSMVRKQTCELVTFTVLWACLYFCWKVSTEMLS